MRAVLCVHVVYICSTHRCGAHCRVFTTTCCTRDLFYGGGGGGSGRLLVDSGSPDVSLDHVLGAQNDNGNEKYWYEDDRRRRPPAIRFN